MEATHQQDLLHHLKIEYTNCKTGATNRINVSVTEDGHTDISLTDKSSRYHLIIMDILLNQATDKFNHLLRQELGCVTSYSPIGELRE